MTEYYKLYKCSWCGQEQYFLPSEKKKCMRCKQTKHDFTIIVEIRITANLLGVLKLHKVRPNWVINSIVRHYPKQKVRITETWKTPSPMAYKVDGTRLDLTKSFKVQGVVDGDQINLSYGAGVGG